MQNILLSDTSSEEEDEKPMKLEELHFMLKMHKRMKKHKTKFYQDPEVTHVIP